MDYVKVDSSNVESLAYDPDRKVMRVIFLHGGEYEYKVTEARFNSILNADSVGKAVHQLRKDGVEGRKV